MFRIGDRVKFQSTSTLWLHGTVVDIDGTIGVRFDVDILPALTDGDS